MKHPPRAESTLPRRRLLGRIAAGTALVHLGAWLTQVGAALALLGSAPLPAQNPWGGPQGPTTPPPSPFPQPWPPYQPYQQQGASGGAQIPPSGQGPEGLQDAYGFPRLQQGFQSLDTTFPSYRGFPTFAPSVPGYGVYPGTLDPTRLGPPPPAPARSDQWPTWIIGSETGVPAPAAGHALLTHVAERVWYLEAGETAYVPLAFYDRFRLVPPDSSVHVSTRGEFLLAFHDTTNIRSFGPAHVDVLRLTDEVAALAIPTFERMWITARTRLLRILLPDGSELEASGTELQLQSTDLDQRGTVYNYGPGEVKLRTPAGEVLLVAARRSHLFLRPPEQFVPAPLEVAGAARAERRGRTLVVEAGAGGGAVAWSGARFDLPADTSLRLDPLAGDDFPDYRRKHP